MTRNLLFPFFLIFLFILSCKKGEFSPDPAYMKLSIDAFYSDSALFSSVTINDETITQNAFPHGGGYINLINREMDAQVGDSARVKLLVVKKNNINISLDTVLHFTNNNEFLLLQFDPKAAPVLINKKIESATLKKPGEDSVKLRFFYNASDGIMRKNNRAADSVCLQLYKSEYVRDGEYRQPVKDVLLKGIRSNVTSEYYSLFKGNSSTRYGFELLDGHDGKTVLQTFEWNSEDGFIKGVLDYYGDGDFRSLRLRKSTREGEYSFTLATGFNAEYVFGMN